MVEPTGRRGIATVSPDGKLLATVGGQHEIQLLDCQSGENKGALRGHRAAVVHCRSDVLKNASHGRSPHSLGQLWRDRVAFFGRERQMHHRRAMAAQRALVFSGLTVEQFESRVCRRRLPEACRRATRWRFPSAPSGSTMFEKRTSGAGRRTTIPQICRPPLWQFAVRGRKSDS